MFQNDNYSDQADINCTAVEIEYETEKRRCYEIYDTCMTKQSTCAVQEFCSDECRSIYYEMLWCTNNTVHLQYLNLFCSTSSDLQYQNSSCLDLSIILEDYGYSYSTNCGLELGTELAADCTEECWKKLMSYKNDCCPITLAVAQNLRADENNDDLISIHDHELWEHCEIESPKICPTPSCPATSTPTPTDKGAASTHHSVNWFLFTIVFILCIL